MVLHEGWIKFRTRSDTRNTSYISRFRSYRIECVMGNQVSRRDSDFLATRLYIVVIHEPNWKFHVIG